MCYRYMALYKCLFIIIISHGDQRDVKCEIIQNILVSSFGFIQMPMLLVYGYYKYVYSAGIDIRLQILTSDSDVYRRQILTSIVDPGAVRVEPYTIIWCGQGLIFYTMTGCGLINYQLRISNWKFISHLFLIVTIVGRLREREVACSASDRQGLNFESCGQCHLYHLTILRRFSWPSLAYMCTKVA